MSLWLLNFQDHSGGFVNPYSDNYHWSTTKNHSKVCLTAHILIALEIRSLSTVITFRNYCLGETLGNSEQIGGGGKPASIFNLNLAME